MLFATSRRSARTSFRFANLFCSASIVAMAAGGAGAFAGEVVAQADEIPETVLITGSLISGAVSVGVPVNSLRTLDFVETGQLSLTDVLQTIPSLDIDAQSSPTYGGGTLSFLQNVQIHSLGTGNGTEGLLLVNGLRFPPQNYSNDTTNPSIIPSIAIERIDLLTAGASAVYGSDATSGVINIILRRGFDGAMTQVGISTSPGIGYYQTQAAQLYGHTWDTGNITVSYTRTDGKPVLATEREYYNQDFRPLGLMDLTPRGSSLPGTVHVGNDITVNWRDPGNPVPAGFDADLGGDYCGSASTTWPYCYAIPRGQNGVGLTWAEIVANQGNDPTVKNLINNWSYAHSRPATRWNQFHFTLDQRISPDLFGFLGSTSFFMQGFYSDQRGKQVYPGGNGQARASLRTNLQVPTTNPFYPIGAPSNLRVDYAFIYEVPVYITGGERAANLSGGFNFDRLPFDWTGSVTYSYTNDMNYGYADNTINTNHINAALGRTVAAEGIYKSYTKPSGIPYLNVFCDPLAFTCNDPETLKYLVGVRYQDEHYKIEEIGAQFQGPIFQLPGGPLEGAIAFQSLKLDYDYTNLRNDNTHSTDVYERLFSEGRRDSYAFFGQINIPVVGPEMNIPLIENFLIELGYRYDHYSDLDDPVYVRKVAANWTVGYGFTLRGAWGESFRVPSFNEGGDRTRLAGYNPLGGFQNDTDILVLRCLNNFPGGVSGVATPGSVTAILNPTCNQTDPTLYQPGAVATELSGGGHAKILRGYGLQPMTLQQWSTGFHFTPPTGLLAGLDADVSMFRLEFRGLIDSVNINTTSGDDPLFRDNFTVIPRPDLSINAPENAAFKEKLAELTAFPSGGGFGFDPSLCSTGNPPGSGPTCFENIKVIQDTALQNLGSRVFSGIDFVVRYDRPIGDWGSVNVGASGYYQILDKVVAVEGGGEDNRYKDKDSGNRLQRVRYRLGWISPGSDWNVTLFAQYYGHGAVGDQASQGNNLNGVALIPQCFYAEGFGPGSCYPGSPYYGPQSVYMNQTPAVVHFDLSIGYQTGETPANEWLRNIGIQFTIVDIFDEPSPYCVCARGNGGIRWNNEGFSDLQRTFTLQLTKVW